MAERKPKGSLEHDRSCIDLQIIPLGRYIASEMHGSMPPITVTFRMQEVITPEMIPSDACPIFAERMLRAFGPGGKRNLEDPVYFPYEGLGRKPDSRPL